MFYLIVSSYVIRYIKGRKKKHFLKFLTTKKEKKKKKKNRYEVLGEVVNTKKEVNNN
jgi:hypothetical protein